MRRPLLLACLCLVLIMAFRHFAGSPPAGVSPGGGPITVTGRVYQKDANSFYLKVLKCADESRQDDSQTNQETSQEINQKVSQETSQKTNQEINQEKNLEVNQSIIQDGSRLICGTEDAEQVLLGSIVVLQGDLEAFSEATNPGEFDYAKYYHSLGFAARVKNVQILSQGKRYSYVLELLYKLKIYWKGRLYRIFPEKEASVMTAILLGDKGDLDSGVKALYKSNGVIHILSISGLHITVIGLGLYRLLRRLGMPVWPAALCGGTLLLLYGIMTGLSVSACRAIGMYLLRMLSYLCGRTYDMLTALGVLAVILVWSNPGYTEHMGFLLSFGSILGVGVLCPALTPAKAEQNPRVERYVQGRVQRFLFLLGKRLWSVTGQGFLAGFSVTLTTLPVQLWFSYEVPVYSILLNMLILPFMSAVMVFGLIAMLVPGLGWFGTVDVLILTGYEKLCALFDRLPFHTWNPGRPQVWQMLLFGALWLAVVWGTERYRQMRKQGSQAVILRYPCAVGLAKFAVLAGAVICLGIRIPMGDRITFLDVGQGDCICVQLAAGEVYLFDCGSSSRSKIGERVLIPFLKYYGISHVDAVFLSHPDADHMNGLMELFALGEKEYLTVERVVLPGIAKEARERAFGEVLSAIADAPQRRPIAVSYVDAGDSLWSEEIFPKRFLCLHPTANFQAAESNAYSECFYMELQGGFSLLLTGDVDGAGENALLAELRKQGIDGVTVLKAAHHGSRYTNSEELLAQISPQMAVISCGRKNRYGHPHEEVLERLEAVGAAVLRTDTSGAVTLDIRRGQVRVESFR